MTRDEFEFSLESNGFTKQRFTEYNNDAFVNGNYCFEDKQLHLEVFVDFYNVRIIWWHEKGKKVSKCYYVKNDLPLFEDAKTLLDNFIRSMKTLYGII